MTDTKFRSLAELMAEEEATTLKKVRAEIAAERKAWLDLTQDERNAITAAKEARMAAYEESGEEPTDCDICGEELDDGDCPVCDGDGELE
jgi:hypothetical protein